MKNSDWFLQRFEFCNTDHYDGPFNVLHKINNTLMSRNLFTFIFGGQCQLNCHNQSNLRNGKKNLYR